MERYELVSGRRVAIGGTHGGPNTYVNRKCRCEPCTIAHRKTSAVQRAKRHARTAANGGVAPIRLHNEMTYTNWGCRCNTCRNAWAEADRRRAATKC